MSELRQIPRWQIGEKAKIKLKDVDWESKCCLEDLNLKGVKVSFKDKLPENPVFGMTLDLKNHLIINVEVRVCWDRKIDGRHYYGLEFRQIRDIEKEEISQYLQKNCFDQFKQNWWPEEKKNNEVKKSPTQEDRSKFFEIVDPENFL